MENRLAIRHNDDRAVWNADIYVSHPIYPHSNASARVYNSATQYIQQESYGPRLSIVENPGKLKQQRWTEDGDEA